MKSIFIACLFVFGLVASASAQTVTNNLSWTVSNPGSPNPATEFRVEKDMGGTWQALATVPSSQLTYADVGNPPGLYSYRIVPMANGMDGTPSNTAICGAVAPDTTVSLTCSATVVP